MTLSDSKRFAWDSDREQLIARFKDLAPWLVHIHGRRTIMIEDSLRSPHSVGQFDQSQSGESASV